MTLVELHLDVTRVANALEKIASLLEKLVFEPRPADVKVHQATLDDLHTTNQEDVEILQAKQMDFAEKFRVVPGSPAMMQALVDWEDQQRSIHGKEWKAPEGEEWRSILAAVQRDQVREPAGAAGPASQRRSPETAETGTR